MLGALLDKSWRLKFKQLRDMILGNNKAEVLLFVLEGGAASCVARNARAAGGTHRLSLEGAVRSHEYLKTLTHVAPSPNVRVYASVVVILPASCM